MESKNPFADNPVAQNRGMGKDFTIPSIDVTPTMWMCVREHYSACPDFIPLNDKSAKNFADLSDDTSISINAVLVPTLGQDVRKEDEFTYSGSDENTIVDAFINVMTMTIFGTTNILEVKSLCPVLPPSEVKEPSDITLEHIDETLRYFAETFRRSGLDPNLYELDCSKANCIFALENTLPSLISMIKLRK